MALNYVAKLQAKLDDPATTTADYLAAWNEMQDIQFRQRCIDEEYKNRVAQLVVEENLQVIRAAGL